MALVLADRVQQTGTANTTVSFTLSGSVTGFQSFSTIGNTNTTYYSAFDTSGNWETGLGTYSTTGPTLTRTTIYQSSNSNAAVTFSGSVNVFVTYPAGKSVNQDTNSNVSNNTFFSGYSNTAAAGTITTLTASSVYNYVVTGSGGQTFKLPDATTLPSGALYTFNNNQSSGTIVVQNNSSTTVVTIQSGGFVTLSLLSNATAAGSWDTHYGTPSNVSWSTNTFDYAGSITSATWNGSVVQVNRGGTGLATLTANYIPYGNGTSAFANSSSLTYTSATGALRTPEIEASNGLIVNNLTIGTSYSIPAGYSASSVGPVTVSGGVSVTVPTGSRWVVL
jgi:hypothetical protein